jgi:activator of HSP90 ATPase
MIEPVTAGGSEQDAAKDARAEEAEREAEYTFLKKMRPVVARSNDQAIIDEFNARLNRFTSSPRASKSTYAGVARGAAARDNDFKDENTVNKELDEMYASFHGKTYREVK